MVGSVYCSRRHSISLRSNLSLSKKRRAISNFLAPIAIAEVLSYNYLLYNYNYNYNFNFNIHFEGEAKKSVV